MPPASQFLKHSKTKMQAWVTSNGLNNSQPAPAGSGPGTGHDGQSHLPQRHVYLPQPTPAASQPAQTVQATQNSPPRSRAPIVNANSNRAAAVAAAKLPVPAGRNGHTRDTSLNIRRSGTVASEPIQSSRRPAPFWEGSTVDGSMFSDTASNVDANAAGTSMYRMPFRAPITYQQRGNTPRPRPPAKDEANMPDQHAPFVIGPNGIIDVVGGPLTRSASTPDARNHRGHLKGVSSPELDQESEDSPYQTSPEKTPSAKRLHHPKALALRNNRRGSFSERAAFPQENIVSSPPREAYPIPDNDLDDDARSERSVHLRVKTLPEHQHRRSTIFADTDTPMVSHPDESDRESVAPPAPAPKLVAKPKPQLNRQLFIKGGNKGGLGLHESAMPRSSIEKRVSNPKKRQYELDYDDGALAAMDYSELKDEVFDFDPAQAEAQSAIGPPRGTLPEKLDHFFDKDQESQMEFFSKMPVKDWEISGDWFLERFGEVMQRFREARQAKRTVIQDFENEIADRDEAVRSKIRTIDSTLAELKNEGEGMMNGKEFD
ncbi:extracellular mutant protein 11-domain-containing protein [Daldinia vernicosa]|uniref:extracellular mutant protein 11-domain-containing protein n=1 Tax=Daldinia vernicosa TaxID=114800 RepID=UPI0020077EC9|nr:extracellular mutant protein 11-domain-containing protein [Daldinia vernicosa]KAI0852993.1 extracellular mutant protein 11-domain-containing protein [Daldinia vernicosa]